ncbi:MAG: FAD-binding protein [Magnetovibrio sp.]|nr:FAD-binding protein [Magnetovibrio sp.]
MSRTAISPIHTIQDELKALFDDRITLNPGVCNNHGRGEGPMASLPPDAVVFPITTTEVSVLAKLCNKARVPIIPFGVGTSLEGHVAAPQGGVCVDFAQMNNVLAVNTNDMDAVVQPGVTRKQLNSYIRDTGLFFPVDPGADASIGGMTATRASGTSTVRYGSMKDNVIALEVVMADGSIIKTASRARKSAAGYDLTHLMIGSEGTLGIITEITVKLHGIPEAVVAAACPFPTIDKAVKCVITAIQMGIPMARMELLDETSMAAVNAYSKLDYTVAPTLFLEFEGSPNSVKEQVETLINIAQDLGANDFQWADKPEDRSRLWAARHDMYYAGLAYRPGSESLTTDVCVPISNLAQSIHQTHNTLAASSITGLILGHVGDGNYHTLLLFDPNDPEQNTEAQRINKTIVEQALALDGTCTGEHGVGMGKRHYLKQELGKGAVAMMTNIKQSLDPNNILNPEKIISLNEMGKDQR